MQLPQEYELPSDSKAIGLRVETFQRNDGQKHLTGKNWYRLFLSPAENVEWLPHLEELGSISYPK